MTLKKGHLQAHYVQDGTSVEPLILCKLGQWLPHMFQYYSLSNPISEKDFFLILIFFNIGNNNVESAMT